MVAGDEPRRNVQTGFDASETEKTRIMVPVSDAVAIKVPLQLMAIAVTGILWA